MIWAPAGSPLDVCPIGAVTAGRPGRDACEIQKVWLSYGRSPSGVVMVRSVNGLVSCGKAGVKFVGQTNTSMSSKYCVHAAREAMRRVSCSATSVSFAKSSPGCWWAKNKPTWKPNDSACAPGSMPSGQPLTIVAPARPSASTASFGEF